MRRKSNTRFLQLIVVMSPMDFSSSLAEGNWKWRKAETETGTGTENGKGRQVKILSWMVVTTPVSQNTCLSNIRLRPLSHASSKAYSSSVAIVILNTGRPQLSFRKLPINFHDVATTNSGTCSPTPDAQLLINLMSNHKFFINFDVKSWYCSAVGH